MSKQRLTLNKWFGFCFLFLFLSLQQFGKILDVEIIFNERGSKVSPYLTQLPLRLVSLEQGAELGPMLHKVYQVSSLG